MSRVTLSDEQIEDVLGYLPSPGRLEDDAVVMDRHRMVTRASELRVQAEKLRKTIGQFTAVLDRYRAKAAMEDAPDLDGPAD